MPDARRTKKKNPKPRAPRSNPALKELEILVGEWEMELSQAAFLPSPSDTAKGFVSFDWVEDGAFLEMRQGEKLPSPPAAIWLIGRDESSGEFHALYFDSRGVSRVYAMSFADGIWKIWRESPGFFQRYEGRLSEDHNTINARWEKSLDGMNWEHDFNMTYTRLG